jgi:hypothetical protein
VQIQIIETTGKEVATMKRYMKLLMIWTMVLIGAALFMSSNVSAIIVGTAPAGTIGTTIIGPVLPGAVTPLGLASSPGIGLPPGLAKQPFGLPPGLVRPPLFNPFLIRPIFNPFLINPIVNPFIDVDGLGLPLGVGVNPGLVD